MTPEEKLRRYLGDKIETGEVEADKFFTDNDITSLLTDNGNDLIVAAADGWMMKVSQYAELIDSDESGSGRKLSQKYRQALERSRYFAQKVIDLHLTTASALRVVARVASLDESNDQELMGPYATPFSGYTDSVRTFPTHRMGAMKE